MPENICKICLVEHDEEIHASTAELAPVASRAASIVNLTSRKPRGSVTPARSSVVGGFHIGPSRAQSWSDGCNYLEGPDRIRDGVRSRCVFIRRRAGSGSGFITSISLRWPKTENEAELPSSRRAADPAW